MKKYNLKILIFLVFQCVSLAAYHDMSALLKLKKLITIQDQPGKFNFMSPGNIQIAKNGNIYLSDYRAVFYFSPEGEYLGNLFKLGQGPGEHDNLFAYFVDKDEVYTYNLFTSKVIVFNLNGKILREFKIPGKGLKLLMGVHSKHYYYRLFSNKEMNKKPKTGIGEVTNYYSFDVWGESDKKQRSSDILFSNKKYMIMNSSGTSSFSKNVLTFSNIKINQMAVSRAETYSIDIIDLEKMKVTAKFKRQYKRVKFVSPYLSEKELKQTSSKKIPSREYFNDILKIIYLKNVLLVVTSTYDASKGLLIDVYNKKWKLKRQVYLPLRNTGDSKYVPFNIKNGKLYIKEFDEDDNAVIVVYKILNPELFD